MVLAARVGGESDPADEALAALLDGLGMHKLHEDQRRLLACELQSAPGRVPLQALRQHAQRRRRETLVHQHRERAEILRRGAAGRAAPCAAAPKDVLERLE